ncbi:ComF family protein [Roseomonas sp. M0104]|uniref:ComF family protein n=1 Tax=Teichococcus coralli TaxID=2545983 RepID=A0A845B258_9PROT|nr:ComF family protein [Pseudoroseomonas coralli]MXP61743.1 ComF family protein [Pseudoroseomonas coralli]
MVILDLPAAGQALRARWRRLGSAALDALLPPRCPACAALVLTEGTLCPDCFRAVTPVGEPLCHCCGLPFLHAGQGEALAAAPGGELHCARCAERRPLYGRARAAWLYDAGSKRLILPFKYGDRTELAGLLSRQMAQAGRALLAEADLLLPVPLHRGRLLARRYNQAGLLAARLSRLSGTPWAPNLLRRARHTPKLAGLGAAQRLAVLDGAFCLARHGGSRVAGRQVLLVDDVLTSGATVSACAAVLLAAGATQVDVVAVARTPGPELVEMG